MSKLMLFSTEMGKWRKCEYGEMGNGEMGIWQNGKWRNGQIP
jgi:hypothetical protein